MTGQEDIEVTCEIIADRMSKLEDPPPLIILPIYSQLAADMQVRDLLRPGRLISRSCPFRLNLPHLTRRDNFPVPPRGFIHSLLSHRRESLNRLLRVLGRWWSRQTLRKPL
mmetsp:Transcript_20256/g.81515  ORF Transcript_20256/g.81515 Transcript_20256/m.81515 type:complete len:111 (-) Transcript_20256:1258-1590(-)